ncbi:MAG: BACON domain-containing protein, partial [Rikenellaceae bacterium]
MLKLLKSIAIAAVALLFFSCEEELTTTSFGGVDAADLTFELYADDTTISSSFSFIAPESWYIDINEITKSESWITVEPMSGPAGYAELTITASANSSGEARGAEIAIVAGEEKLTLTIEQSELTAEQSNSGGDESNSGTTGDDTTGDGTTGDDTTGDDTTGNDTTGNDTTGDDTT